MRPILLLLLILTISTVAMAAPETTIEVTRAPDTLTRDARQRWDEGMAAVERHDLEGARVAFKQAYALKPVPEVLRMLAAAEILTGRDVEGARHLDEVLRKAAKLTAQERADLNDLLRKVESRVGRIVVTVDAADADVLIDGEQVGRSPLGFAWHVTPGVHKIKLYKQGFRPVERDSTARAGEVTTEAFTLEPLGQANEAAITPGVAPTQPAPSRDSSVPPSTPTRSPVAGKTVAVVAGAGLTAVALGMTIGFALKGAAATSDRRELQRQADALYGPSACASGSSGSSALCADLDAKSHDRASAYRIANATFFATAVFAVATVGTLLLWPEERRPAPSGARLRPGAWAAQGAAGLQVDGRF
jgi:hypothetical protein